jgi:hypothetical protein
MFSGCIARISTQMLWQRTLHSASFICRCHSKWRLYMQGLCRRFFMCNAIQARKVALSGLLSNLCQKSRVLMSGSSWSLRFHCKQWDFRSALGRTRTCDLLIRSLRRVVRSCSPLLVDGGGIPHK